MSSDAFVEQLWAEGASAIIRTDSSEIARQAMNAAIEGGFRIVEFTLTVPDAFDLIHEFSRRDVIVGAGTVLLEDQLDAAVAAGAKFLVSPIADEAIIRRAQQLGVPVIPGVHTPTEMISAHRAGAPLLKLFPAPAGGPTWLRSVLGPLPFLRVVPTNGVDAENVADWLRAGAWACGFVGAVFDPSDLAERRFDRVAERAARVLLAARAVSRGRPPLHRDLFATIR